MHVSLSRITLYEVYMKQILVVSDGIGFSQDWKRTQKNKKTDACTCPGPALP